MINPVQCPKQCSQPIQYKGVAFVKKGMAKKAFKKYLANGDIEKIKAQIKKGTVLYYGL